HSLDDFPACGTRPLAYGAANEDSCAGAAHALVAPPPAASVQVSGPAFRRRPARDHRADNTHSTAKPGGKCTQEKCDGTEDSATGDGGRRHLRSGGRLLLCLLDGLPILLLVAGHLRSRLIDRHPLRLGENLSGSLPCVLRLGGVGRNGSPHG